MLTGTLFGIPGGARLRRHDRPAAVLARGLRHGARAQGHEAGPRGGRRARECRCRSPTCCARGSSRRLAQGKGDLDWSGMSPPSSGKAQASSEAQASYRLSAAGILAALLVSSRCGAVAPGGEEGAARHGRRTATACEDDYFWLRERDNPEVLAYLGVGGGLCQRDDDGHRGAAGHAVQGDAGPDQGNRRERALPARWLPLLHAAPSEGKQYPIYARRRGSMDSRRSR